jgi:oligopeptide/dipeptide ABC transporter ATP-binding protein
VADRDTLFAAPRHPYTEILLSAVPVPNPRVKPQRMLLQGDPPSPANPPPGCRFHTRCPLAQAGVPRGTAAAHAARRICRNAMGRLPLSVEPSPRPSPARGRGRRTVMSTRTTYDLVIRGGTVIDGSKSPRFDADVGIIDGRIAAVGELAGASAVRTIDATGLIVAARLHRFAHPRRPGPALASRHGLQGLAGRDDGDRRQLRHQRAPLVRGMKLPMPLDLIDDPHSSATRPSPRG